MKRNVFFVLAFALVIAGCKNYDDQFNDLNSQISSLATQVSGLSKVQSDLASLSSTVASLQSSISSLPSATDFGAAVSGLQALSAKVDELQKQLDKVASSEDLDKVNNSLDGVKDDLDDLLKSSNVFNGDLTINSAATLEFAESLKGKVAIINGNVEIKINTDMDVDKLQAVTSQIKTITKNLSIRAANSNIKPIALDSLSGVGDLSVTLPGSVSFKMLQSAANITLGNNYQSKLTGNVDFSSLKQVKKFTTASVADDFTTSSNKEDAISLSKISVLKLGKLPYYANAELTIEGNKNTTLELDALKTINASGKEKSYKITINRVLDFTAPGLTVGTVNVTDVKNVKLDAFTGTINVNDGVENVTVGALKNNFTAPKGNDLETLNLAMNAASKKVDLTEAKGLTSVSISGRVKEILLKDNDDLTSFKLDAIVLGLTIENTNLSTEDLAYTNANLVKDSWLTIKGNTDLTSFKADKINGLEKLEITGNSDLENISFDALKKPASEDTPGVKIGGKDKDNKVVANAFNATSIKQEGVGSSKGSFSSDSGLDDLKDYLTEAAKNKNASLKVFFDSADEFNDTNTTVSNIKITGSDTDVARLAVINRDGSSDAKKAKRAFLVHRRGNGTLRINGTTITWSSGATAADFVSALTVGGNVARAKNNGVTLTANAKGNPKATAQVSQANNGTIGGVTAATKKAAAQQIQLAIGDYSATLYLSTADITDLTYDPIAGSDKSAEKEVLVVNGTTTVQDILNHIVGEFGDTVVGTSKINASSPYSIVMTNTLATQSSTLNIAAKDRSNAHEGKVIKFKVSNGITGFTPSINNAAVTGDDRLIGEDAVIIIESDVAGRTLSNIGNPTTTPPGIGHGGDWAGDAAGGKGQARIEIVNGHVIELYNDTSVKKLDESTTATNQGVDSTTGTANVNRISWLAG